MNADLVEVFPIPPGAIARFGPPPLWLRGGASGLAFSPDGLRLVAASRDTGIVAFDPQTGAAVARFEWVMDRNSDEPESVAFSPDGRLLAAASTLRVVLYEADTGSRIRTLRGRAPVSFAGRRALLFREPYSADHRVLFADAETGETRGALPPGAEMKPRVVSHFAGSADGRLLAFDLCDYSGAIVIDLRTARALARIAEPEPPDVGLSVVAIAISPDGGLVCSKRSDEPFRLWRVPRSPLQRFAARLRLFGVPWTPPGWSGPRLLDFGRPQPVFSPDGSLLAVADDRYVSVCDRARDSVRFILPAGLPMSLAFSRDCTTLAVGESTGKIRLLDAASGADRLPADDAGARVWALAFSPDGSTILASAGGRVRGFDVRTRAEVPVTGMITPVGSGDREQARSPSGDLVARGVWSAVELWPASPREPGRAGEEEPLLRLPLSEHSMASALAFSPDGRLLAAGTNARGRIRLFEMPHGRHRTDLAGHAGFATALAFSPDCRLLASAGDDGCIYVWDAS